MSYSSGNFSHVPASALPTDVESDTPPCGVAGSMAPSGNFLSTHSANISSNYTPQHPLVTGRSSFSGATNFQNTRGRDVAPEIHPYEGFKLESKRLETFNDWPSNANVTKENLARNGFIYIHTTDRAQCVFCRGVLSNWDVGDVVEDEHRKHCPECPFAFNYECGNIPLNRTVTSQRIHHPIPNHSIYVPPQPQQQQQQQQQQQHPMYNTTVKIPVPPQNISQHTLHVAPPPTNNDINIYSGNVILGGNAGNFVQARYNIADARGTSEGTSLPSLPIGPPSLAAGMNAAPTNVPKYKDWADEGIRLRSYVRWPSQMTQKPLDLARAGLLYMGAGDRCKCFWCGGELYDWEPEDVPWEEHAKWFSHCNYVRGVKGDQYIQYVKDKQNGLIVEPPSQYDLISNPHVLAVIQGGYTQDQVVEVFNRYGAGRFVDARTIVEAIEQTRNERQAMLNQSNASNTVVSGNMMTLNMVGNDSLQDDDVNMEEEETEQSGQNATQSTSVQRTAKCVKDPTSKTSNSRPGSAASDPSTSNENKKDVDSVFLENEKLKDQKLCKICLDNELSITFLPCGHLATCEDCSNALNECPICRKAITQKVKVFWS